MTSRHRWRRFLDRVFKGHISRRWNSRLDAENNLFCMTIAFLSWLGRGNKSEKDETPSDPQYMKLDATKRRMIRYPASPTRYRNSSIRSPATRCRCI
jgi:hypothetical protein